MSTNGAQKYGDVGTPARRSRRSRFAYAWSWRRASRTASAFGASLLRLALNDVPKARDDRPAAREQERTRAHAAQRAELECRHRENTALSGVGVDERRENRAGVDGGRNTVQTDIFQRMAVDGDAPNRTDRAVL